MGGEELQTAGTSNFLKEFYFNGKLGNGAIAGGESGVNRRRLLFLMGSILAYLYTYKNGLVEWEELVGCPSVSKNGSDPVHKSEGLLSEWSM